MMALCPKSTDCRMPPPLLLLLLLQALLLRQAAAAEACAAVVATPLPENNADYVSRFDASYSTYHKYTAAAQALGTAAKDEVLEAQERRNSFRDITRWEPPSHRFCGLTYPPGPGGYDCMPTDTNLQDATFLQKCYNVRPSASAPARQCCIRKLP